MSHSLRITHLSLLAVGLVLSGCATSDVDNGFADVRQNLSDRLPAMQVTWNSGSADDDAVKERVDQLLARELSEDQAVQIALLNNNDVQATYESLAIAQADLVEAGLLRNPVFDAQIRFATGGGAGIDVGVIQDFLDVFQISLRKRVAAANFEAEKFRVTGAVIDLAADTRRGYIELVAAMQTIELRQTVVSAYELSYDVARRLHDAGNVTDLDLARERGQYEQSKLDLAAAESDVVVRREELASLLGLWGPRATALKVAARLAEPNTAAIDSAALERTAVARSLTLASLRQQVRADYARLGLSQRFALLDRSELTAGAVGERSSESGEWEVGPAFSIPIPIFNTGAPAIARARAMVRSANRRFTQTAVDVRASVRIATARLIAARQQVDYYRRVLIPTRTTILRQTQLTYNAMLIGPFQLFQAKRDQVETAIAAIDAQRRYWQARTSLEQIIAGQGGQVPIERMESFTSSPATRTLQADH